MRVFHAQTGRTLALRERYEKRQWSTNYEGVEGRSNCFYFNECSARKKWKPAVKESEVKGGRNRGNFGDGGSAE